MPGLYLSISGADLALAAALLAAFVLGAASAVLVALAWLARRLGVTAGDVWGMWRG